MSLEINKESPKEIPIKSISCGNVSARPKKSDGGKKQSAQSADDFSPNDEAKLKAQELGVCVETESEKFKNWCKAKGKTYKNWQCAFKNWLINAGEFAKERKGKKVRQESLDEARAIAIEKLTGQKPYANQGRVIDVNPQ